MTRDTTIYTIAMDFDGTIVEHRYPKIGEEREGAIENLLKIQAEGHRLILWTVREGCLLEEAVEWCCERGIRFYAVNRNYPEETTDDRYFSRKLQADIFVDDRSLGGLPSWSAIYEMISTRTPLQPYRKAVALDPELQMQMQYYQPGKKRSLWQWLIGK